MATEPIDIPISTTGAGKAAQDIKGVGDAAGGAGKEVTALNSALGFMKTALAGLGVGVLLNELRQQSDAYASIVNRLKLVTTSQAELIKTEQSLFDISQRTRASFQGTANLYNKLAIQVGNLGIEQSQLLPVLETINQAIAVSGATSQEASAGLLQFSQGLASNRFQGDELRSVLENLPQLGVAIAKGLGVTTGELRKMGEEGKLTTKAVLDALQKTAPEIARQFQAITPTIGQAFQVLQNSLLRFIGQADQAAGVSRFLAQAVVGLANNLGTLINVLAVATAGFIAYRASLLIAPIIAGVSTAIAALRTAMLLQAGATQAATVAGAAYTLNLGIMGTAALATRTAVQALWAVIRANPFVFIATVITVAVTALYTFGQAVRVNASGSISALGAVVGTINFIIAKLGELYNWLIGPLSKVWNFVAEIAVKAFNLIAGGVQKLLDLLPNFIKEFFKLNELGEKFGKFTEGLTKSMEEATKSFDKTGLAAADLGKGFKEMEDSASGASGKVKELPPALEGAKGSMRGLQDETRQTADVWRNAFGDMLSVTDEWARRSGEYFNQVSSAAKSMSSSVSSATESAASAAASSSAGGGGGSSSGGGGGSSGAESTTSSIDGAAIIESLKSFVKPAVANQLANLASQTANSIGTPGAIRLLSQLHSTLSKQPKGAARVIQSNYPSFQRFWEQMGLEGFRNGGAFTVGGAGGPDSQLVQFMASPDERVRVETRKQQRQANAAPKGQRPVNVSIQIAAKDVESFRRSKPQVLTRFAGELAKISERL